MLAGDGRVLRQRTAPDVWSPLEYACHVRDVLLAQRERVLLARRVDTPALEPMGRDERVEHDGYNEQHPADVARQLDDAALLFANVLDRLTRADWDRTIIYNFPQRQERPLRWLALHTLHELRHHLLDIRRQLDS
nr:DinB family protein [Nocardia pseudovaccinii]